LKSGIVIASLTVALATTMVTSAPAHAESRMLVLIDASGSMTLTRNNADHRGANRFEAAKSLSTDRVNTAAGRDASLLVAVYTFRRHRGRDLRRHQLVLGLVGVLRIANLDRDHGREPLAEVLARYRCVDRSDAILVARAFGPVVPPVDGRFDLDLIRTVDFTDDQIQASRITSTCGPDPYVAREPVVCRGAKRIVIDGQVIASGGLTIDARGACDITIKNSLIVSGQNAITIVGSALITVDNSIIVGQNAVISQHGASVLSAANSVFHGKQELDGPFHLIDRGGNVFE
jgi:hypothetical protein